MTRVQTNLFQLQAIARHMSTCTFCRSSLAAQVLGGIVGAGLAACPLDSTSGGFNALASGVNVRLH